MHSVPIVTLRTLLSSLGDLDPFEKTKDHFPSPLTSSAQPPTESLVSFTSSCRTRSARVHEDESSLKPALISRVVSLSSCVCLSPSPWLTISISQLAWSWTFFCFARRRVAQMCAFSIFMWWQFRISHIHIGTHTQPHFEIDVHGLGYSDGQTLRPRNTEKSGLSSDLCDPLS